jgi:hypothetical protein
MRRRKQRPVGAEKSALEISRVSLSTITATVTANTARGRETRFVGADVGVAIVPASALCQGVVNMVFSLSQSFLRSCGASEFCASRIALLLQRPPDVFRSPLLSAFSPVAELRSRSGHRSTKARKHITDHARARVNVRSGSIATEMRCPATSAFP